MGEIIARIPAEHRYGFDREDAVIRAARFLYGRKSKFVVATLSDVKTIRDVVKQERADLIIATGWLHGIKIEELINMLIELNNVLPIKMILVDGMNPSKMDPRGVYHNKNTLGRLGEIISSIVVDDGARELHLLRLCFQTMRK